MPADLLEKFCHSARLGVMVKASLANNVVQLLSVKIWCTDETLMCS